MRDVLPAIVGEQDETKTQLNILSNRIKHWCQGRIIPPCASLHFSALVKMRPDPRSRPDGFTPPKPYIPAASGATWPSWENYHALRLLGITELDFYDPTWETAVRLIEIVQEKSNHPTLLEASFLRIALTVPWSPRVAIWMLEAGMLDLALSYVDVDRWESANWDQMRGAVLCLWSLLDTDFIAASDRQVLTQILRSTDAIQTIQSWICRMDDPMRRRIGIVTLGKILAADFRSGNEDVLLPEVARSLLSAIETLVDGLRAKDKEVVDMALIVAGDLVNYEPVRIILYKTRFRRTVVKITKHSKGSWTHLKPLVEAVDSMARYRGIAGVDLARLRQYLTYLRQSLYDFPILERQRMEDLVSDLIRRLDYGPPIDDLDIWGDVMGRLERIRLLNFSHMDDAK